MAAEPIRVVFRVDREPPLMDVLRRAVEFQAHRAGLKSDTCEEFAKACHDVCHEMLSKFSIAGEPLEVTLDTFQDRIEMSVHHHGHTGPAIGLETFAFSDAPAGATGGLNGLELLSRVDQVLFSTENGVARTTLVKFLNSKS